MASLYRRFLRVIVSPSFVIEKSLGQGRFAGLAWSFMDTPDREGDLILPSALARAVDAAKSRPEIRIEHDPDQVAGVIDMMTVTDRGLEVEGQINTAQTIGRKAYDRLSDRSLGALSMGFVGSAETSGRNRVFTEITAIPEISLCREPMNAGSRIHAVKSWAQVDSERALEHLLRDVGMPNRLARKSAAIVWPAISTDDDDARAETLARQLDAITRSLRNNA
ncbi:HK97 family phage prohead protease [Stenotrophomonas sp. Sm2128]|uniref:HK97 family phage prohead protease n=1 Tax=Stenotrophomonas sp. Sm2128 TaxID=3002752 RepID=UPI0027E41DAC|nr:HK97 family phage prohead protease [Stenotrophomonas sp. Sm2128]MDQ7288988.1 HK97 family phage prohead protease [Stenotrophomonas sp. Sm2128]